MESCIKASRASQPRRAPAGAPQPLAAGPGRCAAPRGGGALSSRAEQPRAPVPSAEALETGIQDPGEAWGVRHHSRLCICRLCWRQTLVASRSCSIHLGRGEKWRPGGGCCGRRWVTDDPKRQTRYPGAPPRTQKSTFSAPGRSVRGSLRMLATRGLAAGISEASGGHRDRAPAGWLGEPRGGGSRAANAAPFPRSRRPRTPAGSPAHPRWPLRAPPPSPPRSERGRGTRGARGWAGAGVSRVPAPSRGSRGGGASGLEGALARRSGAQQVPRLPPPRRGRGGGPGAEARRGGGRSLAEPERRPARQVGTRARGFRKAPRSDKHIPGAGSRARRPHGPHGPHRRPQAAEPPPRRGALSSSRGRRGAACAAGSATGAGPRGR